MPIGTANAVRLALRLQTHGEPDAGARSSRIKPSFQRLAHAFGDHGRIVVDRER